MSDIGSRHDSLSLLDQNGCSFMNTGGREQIETSVVMLIVIPMEEAPRPGAGRLDIGKTGWKIKAILQGFELSLTE